MISLIVIAFFITTSAFAETDWSNYDWASEEEVLGPDLNPQFVAVGTEGVEKCRDSVFMINHELWNGLCSDLKKYASRNSDRERLLIDSMNQRFAELRKRFSCPLGDNYLVVIDRRGAVRVACRVHELHLPATEAGLIYGNKDFDIDAFMAARDDWPEQIRFPQFDLAGNSWLQEKEAPSSMKVDVHYVDMAATSITGDKDRARDAHAKGMHYHPAPPEVNLTDRVVKAAAPDKHYLGLARESLDAGRFPQSLQFIAQVFDNDSATPSAMAQADELYRELLRSAETKKLSMTNHLFFTMRLFNNEGMMHTTSDFPEPIRTRVTDLEARLREVQASETWQSIRTRLQPLITRGRFQQFLPLPGNHWLIVLEADVAGTFFGRGDQKNRLWLVGQGVNRLLELDCANLPLDRSQVSMMVCSADVIYLGMLPASADYDSLMKTLRFIDKPGLPLRSLDEEDPQTAAALQILCHRIYRIPLTAITSGKGRLNSD